MRQYEGYEIGPILREIRKDKRLTVEDVADTAGISVSTLSQLEQGGRNLSIRSLPGRCGDVFNERVEIYADG